MNLGSILTALVFGIVGGIVWEFVSWCICNKLDMRYLEKWRKGKQ